MTDLSSTSLEENEVDASKLVQQAIEEFRSFHQILTRVTEVSIFSAPFYVGCFLTLLLSGSAKEDAARQGLIVELFK